jgi:hypothetical protein
MARMESREPTDGGIVSEQLVLVPHRGDAITVDATVRRPSEAQRLTKTGAIVAGGGVLGIAAIILPPHGVWSLGAWAASGVAAYATWTKGAVIEAINGRCSACNAELTLSDVGAWTSDLWVRCPGCQAPYRIQKPSDAPQ